MKRLSRRLLRWTLVPLLLLLVALAPLRSARLQAQADAAHDRALLGSAMVMADHVGVRDGEVVVDIPPLAIEMLESRDRDQVYYKVLCAEPPAFIAGTFDLPSVTGAPDGAPTFADRGYGGNELRMVALHRPVQGAAGCASVQVLVGETSHTRDDMVRRMLVDIAAAQLLLLGCAAACLLYGVRRGLAPVNRLRDAVRARAADDLSLIAVADLPAEVAPLVDAFNTQMKRQHELNLAQQRFVADASHQLKTPLAILRTQADLALRAQEPARMRALVQELRDSVEAMTRVVAQLLALLRSDPLAALAREPVELVEAAREATFDLLPLALDRRIELAFEAGAPATLHGHRVLLHELVANLVDNAVRYTPPGGQIAVHAGGRADGGALLQVSDTGPGIAHAERAKVFERYYRAGGDDGGGCGLGLAIVQQIAGRYGAEVRLDDAPGGGLRVDVVFPAAAAA